MIQYDQVPNITVMWKLLTADKILQYICTQICGTVGEFIIFAPAVVANLHRDKLKVHRAAFCNLPQFSC